MENGKNKSHATKHRRLSLSYVISFLMIVCLAGCMKEKTGADGDNVEGKELNGKYVCTGYYNILSGEETGRIWTGYGNMLFSLKYSYYYKGEKIEGKEIETLVEDYDDFEVKTDVIKQVIDEKEISKQALLCTLDGYAEAVTADEQGNLFLIIRNSATYLGLKDDYFLVSTDCNGKYIFQKALEQGCQPNGLSLSGEGKLLLIDRNQLLLFNKKGDKTATKKMNAVGQIVSACGTKENEFLFVSMGKLLVTKRISGNSEDIMDDEHGFMELRFIPGIGVLGRNTEKIYRYSENEKTWQELLNIIDLDVTPRDVQEWWMEPEGTAYVIIKDSDTNDYGLVVARQKRKEEIEEKEVIRLGVNGNADKLQRMVVGFNRSSEEYRVEIVDYVNGFNPFSGNADAEAASNRMKMDFTSGEGPDLICTDLVRIANIPADGLLEDLTPYLNNSNILRRDDFFDKVLQGCSLDGKLAYLTDSFTISTLLCKSSLLRDHQEHWRVEDVLALAEEYPNALLFQRPVGSRNLVREYSSRQLIENFLMLNQERFFIDKTSDQTVLTEVLIKAKEEYELKHELYDNTYDALKNNELMMINAKFMDFYNIMQFYLGSFGGQDMKVIGYPSDYGQGKSIIMPGMGIGILSASKHKDAAWAFLEYYVLNSDQEDLKYFSSRKSIFEKQMKKAYQFAEEKRNPEDDDYVEYSALQCLQEAIDNAIGSDQTVDEVILNIIFEEIPAFYNGDKSGDEIVDVIENRAQLYLSEKLIY